MMQARCLGCCAAETTLHKPVRRAEFDDGECLKYSLVHRLWDAKVPRAGRTGQRWHVSYGCGPIVTILKCCDFATETGTRSTANRSTQRREEVWRRPLSVQPL